METSLQQRLRPAPARRTARTRALACAWAALLSVAPLPRARAAEDPEGAGKGVGAEGAMNADPAFAIVRQLIEAGRYDEAERTLAGLEGDPGVIDTLGGLLEMARGEPAAALRRFEAALARDPDRAGVWLLAGQALVALERFSEARTALLRAAPAGEDLPAYPRMLARAQAGAGAVGEALATLDAARARFADQTGVALELDLERVRLYALAGLGARARQLTLEILDGETRPPPQALRALASWCARDAGAAAAPVLEALRAAAPGDPELLRILGQAYAAAGMPLAAGRSLAEARWRGADTAYGAADQLRLAGRYSEALAHNAAVADPAARLAQRLTLLREAGDLERAAALEPALDRARCWTDRLRYEMAVVRANLGDHEAARTHLAHVRSAEVRAEADSLRRWLDAATR